MRHEFAAPRAPALRISLAAGRIEVEAADADQTVVEVEAIRGDLENLTVSQRGDEVVVEHRRRFGRRDDEYDVRIQAPSGSSLDVNVAAADLVATGRFASAEVNTASGDVQVDRVDGDAKIRSASGDVRLGPVGGRADVTTASGDVEVRSAGAGGTLRSASGDVRIQEASRRVTVQTASGDQLIGAVDEGVVDLKSASGDLRVGIREGSRLFVDARSLSGDTTSELELTGVETEAEGPLVEVKAQSMSGDIRIVRA